MGCSSSKGQKVTEPKKGSQGKAGEAPVVGGKKQLSTILETSVDTSLSDRSGAGQVNLGKPRQDDSKTPLDSINEAHDVNEAESDGACVGSKPAAISGDPATPKKPGARDHDEAGGGSPSGDARLGATGSTQAPLSPLSIAEDVASPISATAVSSGATSTPPAEHRGDSKEGIAVDSASSLFHDDVDTGVQVTSTAKPFQGLPVERLGSLFNEDTDATIRVKPTTKSEGSAVSGMGSVFGDVEHFDIVRQDSSSDLQVANSPTLEDAPGQHQQEQQTPNRLLDPETPRTSQEPLKVLPSLPQFSDDSSGSDLVKQTATPAVPQRARSPSPSPQEGAATGTDAGAVAPAEKLATTAELPKRGVQEPADRMKEHLPEDQDRHAECSERPAAAKSPEKPPAAKPAEKPAGRPAERPKQPVQGALGHEAQKKNVPAGAAVAGGGKPPQAPGRKDEHDAHAKPQNNNQAKKGRQHESSVNVKDYDLVEKKYEIGSKLGEGTFGVVHDCWRRDDPKKVVHAVKYIDKMAQDKEAILLETSMMRELDHPTIVRCLDVFDEPFFMCIVMEKWTGRDVVSRLIEYTEASKELAEPFVANLVRQMLESLVYIHQKGIIHRDVKMDNYLLDRPMIDDVTVKVALADFGCAAYLELGKRMTEGVGTKVYKAPEFIMEDYDHKVDVWAVGVSQYALLAGTLPFETERAILQTRPSFPEDLGSECLDLLKSLLRKNDARRPSAMEAMEHPFVKPNGQMRHDQFKRTASSAAKSFRHLAARNGPIETSIVERREVLMARVQGHNPVQVAPVFGSDFQVRLTVGKAEEILKFAWWSRNEVERLVAECYLARPANAGRGVRGAMRAGQDSGSMHQLQDISWTPEVLESLLERHNFDVDEYGVGNAKSIVEVADELRRGEAVLMQDVAAAKKLVRLVDHVVLQIELDLDNSPCVDRNMLIQKGMSQLVLVRHGHVAMPSREGGLHLPAAQRRPHETMRNVASRMLDELKMPGCQVALNYDAADRVEAVEDNDVYPSLPSVKRRHIIPGKMRIGNTEALATLGLTSSSLSKVDATRNKDVSIEFMCGGFELGWFTPHQCKVRRVSLINAHTSQNLTTFSTLLRVPINFTEAVINRLMWTYGVDVSKFGKDGKGKLVDLAEELSKGEATLCERRGKVVRVVSMVVLRIDDRATGRSLVEVEHVSASGATRAKDRLPGVKLRPQEDLQDAVGRLVKMRLQLDLSAVRVLEGRTEVVEEERENDRYQGLVTLYRRHVVRAEVTTSSASGQTEATSCPGVADELGDCDDSERSAEGVASSTRRRKNGARKSSLRSSSRDKDKKAKPRKGRQ